jgi:hypothetical protein
VKQEAREYREGDEIIDKKLLREIRTVCHLRSTAPVGYKKGAKPSLFKSLHLEDSRIPMWTVKSVKKG